MDSIDTAHVPPPNSEYFWPFELNQKRTLCPEPFCTIQITSVTHKDAGVEMVWDGKVLTDKLNLDRPCVALRTPEGEPLVTFTLRVVDPAKQTASLQVTVNPRLKFGRKQ